MRLLAFPLGSATVATLLIACAASAPSPPRDDGWSPKLAPMHDSATEPQVVTKTKPRRALPEDASAGEITEAVKERISKVGEQHWRVEREAFDLLLEHQDALLRMARVVPETVDGSVVGLRLFGVRVDSVPGTLGFENGDRVETVNGFPLAKPDQALEAYASLRKATRIDIVLQRAGRTVTLTWDVID